MARELKEFVVENFDAKNFKSMFIEASAGTGKTYTIENLVKALVVAGQPLEETLIVTYTEKAVGELRHRIRDNLSDSSVQADIDNAPIFTIHSFCQKTLEEFSFIARQPYSLALIDESELHGFIDKWIRDELKDDEAFKELYAADKKNTFINDIKKDFTAAVGKYYLNGAGEEDQSIVSLDDIAVVKEATKTLPMQIFTFEECDALLQDGSDAKSYNAAFSKPDTKENSKKVLAYKKNRFYRKTLSRLFKAWQKQKAYDKSQSFDDMIRNVREAVCQENSALAKKLREKYSLAIIDEFQDTNKKQWDIFKTIFMEGSDKEKAAHKIIVVGDPKQSIFAFQGADVNVYTKATQEISAAGGDAFSLLTNYRSTTTMIEACNRVFSAKPGPDGCDGINFFSSQEFFNSKAPKEEDKRLPPAKFGGKETEPFWIFGNAENSVDSETFAEFAVKKIIECCSLEKNGETKLRVYEKDKTTKKPKIRDVSFRDFAILARTSSEMDDIEAALKKYGVPFYRYKDKNLFAGLECASWVSLLNAICARDFNGGNRKYLSEALWTKFFGVKLDQVADESFDNPANAARQKILVWRQIAQDRQWAKLIEAIFEESEIEKALSNSQSIQSVSKFRQIGNYIADYLYSNDCSLEEASKHLTRLSNASEFSEDDGNLVAKGTNFDCVQIMTIHASKGLEFPVVIAACGFKGRYNQIPLCFLYHDQNDEGRAKLGFSSLAKNNMQEEGDEEFRRLFYVAYTRASSLMMIPFYNQWANPSSNGKFLSFLCENFKDFMDDPANKKYYKLFPDKKPQLDEAGCKECLKAILENSAQSKDSDPSTSDSQSKETKTLAEKIPGLGLCKHSYSTLSHSKAAEAAVEEDSERVDKEDAGQSKISLAEFDKSADAVSCQENLFGNFAPPTPVAERYPKGSFLGSAVHEVFEKIDFEKAAKFGLEEFCADDFSNNLIDRCFARQGLAIDEEDSEKWRAQTSTFVWNALNARLPEICGPSQTGGYFSLKKISGDSRSSEARFDMVSEFVSGQKGVLENYCNGAIDLIFTRQVNGKEVYSILDWKSDSFDFEKLKEEGFAAEKDLFKKSTDDKYAIQRVLYSYCLVVWLKEFYGGDEETIFKERFGGIYYVYLRYCEPETSRGIYAQTWKSWSDLKDAFKTICQKLIAQGK